MQSPDSSRRHAVICLTAAQGFVTEARGLVGRALRKSLGISRWHSAPHHIAYEAADDEGRALRRYIGEMTDAEMQAFVDTVTEMAEAEGWNGAPVDVYHD